VEVLLLEDKESQKLVGELTEESRGEQMS